MFFLHAGGSGFLPTCQLESAPSRLLLAVRHSPYVEKATSVTCQASLPVTAAAFRRMSHLHYILWIAVQIFYDIVKYDDSSLVEGFFGGKCYMRGCDQVRAVQ